MHVLGNMVGAVRPSGIVLDLQVIRPHPIVECDGRELCEIDGEPLFSRADAATAAIERFIASGRLVQQAADDHDVRKHYRTGAALVEDLAGSPRRLPPRSLPSLRAIERPCLVRERCRLRRLLVRHREPVWRKDRIVL